MTRFKILILLLLGVLCGMVVQCASSFGAEAPAPGWEVAAHTFPTDLAPGGKGAVEVRVVNIGAANSTGTVTVTDKLPQGVLATGAGSFAGGVTEVIEDKFLKEGWDCKGDGPGDGVAGASVVTCTNDEATLAQIVAGGGIPVHGGSSRQPVIGIGVEIEHGLASRTPEGCTEGLQLCNRVTAEGGGAVEPASAELPVTIGSVKPKFGFADADAWFSNENGTIDTQAGSHPYEASFSFDMNNVEEGGYLGGMSAGGEPRNVVFRLRTGM